MTVFESAFINSFKKHFSAPCKKGVFFHFSQCVWRKIQQYPAIFQKYNADDEFALNLRQLMTIAFVLVVDVIPSFDVLIDTDLYNEHDYFENTWIERPKRDGRCAPLYKH